MPTRGLVNRHIFGNNTGYEWTTTTTNEWTATTTNEWMANVEAVWTPVANGNQKWNAVLKNELERAYDWRFIDYTKGYTGVEEFADGVDQNGVRIIWGPKQFEGEQVENKPEECRLEESQLPEFGEDFDEMVLTI